MPSCPTAIDWPQTLEHHRSWLLKVIRARLGDVHDVEDVYQEVVLAVLKQSQRSQQSLAEGNPRSLKASKKLVVPTEADKVAPWLYRLAVRYVVNFYRRNNRLSHARPAADLEPFAPQPQPLEWILAIEQQQHLANALAQLRPQDREVLTLKYSEGWSYQKMADHLGVPVRNIEYRLLNARKQLRRNLVSLGSNPTVSTLPSRS